MAKNAPVLPATIDSLLQKGGVLIKRGDYWTYPGAENDPSGTNLKIPLEYVSHAVVTDALAKGDLVPRATDAIGTATSVSRPSDDGTPVRVVSMAQAGSVELATELPPNSRPTHDAGRRLGDPDMAAVEAQAKTDPKPVVAGPVAAAGTAPAAAGAVVK